MVPSGDSIVIDNELYYVSVTFRGSKLKHNADKMRKILPKIEWLLLLYLVYFFMSLFIIKSNWNSLIYSSLVMLNDNCFLSKCIRISLWMVLQIYLASWEFNHLYRTWIEDLFIKRALYSGSGLFIIFRMFPEPAWQFFKKKSCIWYPTVHKFVFKHEG